ncbi:MAG: adenosylmethionine decarboxylase [Planctomycetota bacterium]
MAAVGVHCLLELYGCPESKLNDLEYVRKTLKDAATHAGATWLGEASHSFEPHGVTAMGLLAESHISIHTWPEIGYAACDVFTCGDVAMPEKACEMMIKLLGATRHTLAKLPRATQLRPREVEGVDPHEAHMHTKQLHHEILAGDDA